MKINVQNLDIALVRNCMNLSDLRLKGPVSSATLAKIRNEPDFEPTTKTIGKIAKALNVDPNEIIKIS